MSDQALRLCVPSNGILKLPAFVGKWVSITVARRKATRPQFGWYRGIALPLLAEELGYDKHDIPNLHDYILIACFGTKIDKLSGREVPARRTRELNTKEMAEFQSWFSRWCMTEHGVNVPLPGEVE